MDLKITIAIPTYKRLNYLQEAVASALAQTYNNIEVLISQDPTENGLDRSLQVWCHNLISQDSRVRYRFNSSNLGLAGNWNACVDAAQGEYIVIIGDDDRLLPNFVEALLSVANKNTSVIFSNHYLINSQGGRLVSESYQWTKTYHRNSIPTGKVDLSEKWVWRNSIPMSASLIKTHDVKELRFKEDLNTPEIELFLRIAQKGSEFVFVPKYLLEYRVHELSETTQGHKTDILVDYLSSMSVSKIMKKHQQRCISDYIIGLVHTYLLERNYTLVEKYFKHPYYPKWHNHKVKSLIQSCCLLLPFDLGSKIYELVFLFRSNLRKFAKSRHYQLFDRSSAVK